MPLRIGDNVYRLCGIDTNVISEVVKRPRDVLPALLDRVGPAKHLLCLSPYSLFELRRRPDVYEKFLDLFDVWPCALLKNEEQLFEDEWAAYPNADIADPTIFGFSALNRRRGTNLRNLSGIVFDLPDVAKREQEWPNLQRDLLHDWMVLRSNFPPKGRFYQLQDASRFMREATRQHVALRAPDWAQRLRRDGSPLKPAAFPSVMMTLLTVFLRIYEPRGRRPEPQDVFDVLISTPTPYLDVVVTERMQAEILSKAKRVFQPIRALEVFTLRNLRDPL